MKTRGRRYHAAPLQEHSNFKDPTDVIYLKKNTSIEKKYIGKVTLDQNTPQAPLGPERIENAMRRKHRRPRIWGSAVCDSFCKLLRVSGRGCVGTVVDLYGSWRFLAILCRILTAFIADSVALLVPEMDARSGAKGH